MFFVFVFADVWCNCQCFRLFLLFLFHGHVFFFRFENLFLQVLVDGVKICNDLQPFVLF